MSAGRTGTKFLSALFNQNKANPNTPTYHERLSLTSFGVHMPDLSHMLEFNTEGNTDRVRTFWKQKFKRIIEEGSATGYYAETSHRLFKAGLIENLAESLNPEKFTVHLIDLQRDILPTLLSYHSRFDLATYENRWIWYLDPNYRNNLLDFAPYRGLNLDDYMKIRLWYLHEIQTRAHYYRLRYRKHPLFKFHKLTLEELNRAATVAQFFRKADWPLPNPTPIIPEPQNTTNSKQRQSVGEGELQALKSTLNTLSFSPVTAARKVLAATRKPMNNSNGKSINEDNRSQATSNSQDWQQWIVGNYKSESTPIFIGGCPRSGTTLMRVMLDTHKEICCGPESNLLLVNSKNQFEQNTLPQLAKNFDIAISDITSLYKKTGTLAEFIDRFFDNYRERQQAKVWADKTPKNVLQLSYIFNHFPNARFIHVIRDGRAAVRSLKHFPKHKVVNGELVKNEVSNPIDTCAKYWVHHVNAGLAFSNDPRYIEVRYEDLVAKPEITLKKLCESLGLPFDSSMLQYHEVESNSRDVTRFPQNPEATQPIDQSYIEKWRDELTEEQLGVVYSIAGDLLEKLGYLPNDQ